MAKENVKKALLLAGILLGIWVALRFLLPILLPFVLGSLLALAAEPVVRLGVRRLKLPRPAAAAAGVSLTLVLTAAAVSLVGAFLVREAAYAAQIVPDVGQTVLSGMTVLEDWLLQLTQRTPETVRPALERAVLDTFDGGSAVISQVTERIPGVLANTVGAVSRGAVTVGTGILAGFMISARLPRLQQAIQSRLPQQWYSRVLPALRRAKHTIGGWLKAQLKLMLITWGIVSVGLLLLKVPNGILWAALIALVDAVPVLGTGTVLIPWALIELLQGRYLQSAALAVILGAAWVSRSVLEPRLVGHHIGLDPLVTLGAFYVGFRLWGIPGMILAPLLTAAVKGAVDVQK